LFSHVLYKDFIVYKIYDLFYNYENKNLTPVETKDNISYLINSDGDEGWDYQYNIETKEVTEYKTDKGSSDLQEKEGTLNLSLFGIISLLIGLILLLFIVILYKHNGNENFEIIKEEDSNETFEIIKESTEVKNLTNDKAVNPKKKEMEKIREEIIPIIDQMELKEYKNKQKDPIFRWDEQIKYENIAKQIIFNGKSNTSRNKHVHNTTKKLNNNKSKENIKEKIKKK
jgi:hypothetical protein